MAVDRKRPKELSIPRYSWTYEACSKAERWLLMAKAYQECSQHLFGEMNESRLPDTFHHAVVAAYLFEHAVELFLKGGIAWAGKEPPPRHCLEQLYNQFRNLYPGEEYEFSFSIADMVAPSPRTPYNQFTRYPADRSGKPWEGYTHIDLVIWYEQASKFLDDIDRLRFLIMERHQKCAEESSDA